MKFQIFKFLVEMIPAKNPNRGGCDCLASIVSIHGFNPFVSPFVSPFFSPFVNTFVGSVVSPLLLHSVLHFVTAFFVVSLTAIF